MGHIIMGSIIDVKLFKACITESWGAAFNLGIALSIVWLLMWDHSESMQQSYTHSPLERIVYARYGRELMGCKSPMYESCQRREAWT